MTGANLLVKTAIAGGIEVCFANPGTTEAPLVAAFDETPGIKTILGLFEGVCTGAADGYGRMKGTPAMTLLHLGPGFANGIANLHNGRRTRTPIVNLIGEHATWHRSADPPLAMDIEALANTVSGWLRTNRSVDTLSPNLTEAISASLYGQISSLIVPHDHQLTDTEDASIVIPEFSFDPPDTGIIEKAATMLRRSSKSAIILGGPALTGQGLRCAGFIKALIGCDLLANSFPGRVDRGTGLPAVDRIPYFPEPAKTLLSQYEAIIFAGGTEPVTFFGYPGIDSYLLGQDQERIHICSGREDVVQALEYLLYVLKGGNRSDNGNGTTRELRRPALSTGTLTPEKACITLAALQPEGAIIVDEGLTTILPYDPLTTTLPPHTILTIGGGAIGYGIPCAIGAALACPDRPVISFQADGSALYTLQALWTQARERLNITTLICSNGCYNIVRVELERAGIASRGPNAEALTDLGHPGIDWVKIAEGFGVPAASVATAEGLAHELAQALAEPGPHLIEMIL
ncbi:MAG: acetolactate synthase large subunit [Syntrophus sp. (in: bacteria)]|nr:acetolactate synthase large subunit [Syntrophus sp. (in: bacteria)]